MKCTSNRSFVRQCLPCTLDNKIHKGISSFSLTAMLLHTPMDRAHLNAACVLGNLSSLLNSLLFSDYSKRPIHGCHIHKVAGVCVLCEFCHVLMSERSTCRSNFPRFGLSFSFKLAMTIFCLYFWTSALKPYDTWRMQLPALKI